jgi:sugar/nucleoside kinase (ribokinase family)
MIIKKGSSSRMIDVVVAGLAVVDIIGRVIDAKSFPKPGSLSIVDAIKLTSGGNVSNVGIDLVKLGFSVGAITRVGDDELGRFLLDEFRTFNIDTEGVTVDREKQTSSTIVCVGEDGERSFIHTRGCLENFRSNDILKNIPLIKQAGFFALGYLGLLPETEKQFGRILKTVKSKTKSKILLDTGGRPDVNVRALKTFLPYVDYFIPSYEEAVMISGRHNPERIISFFYDAGAGGTVGIKMGKNGCIISDGKEINEIKGRRVRNVIDTTGAGDAFIAGFIAATLRGFNPFQAAETGNKIAADCITGLGASVNVGRFEKYG